MEEFLEKILLERKMIKRGEATLRKISINLMERIRGKKEGAMAEGGNIFRGKRLKTKN